MHRALLCTLLVLGVATAAIAAPLPPVPPGWVDDAASFLTTATRSTLDARLESYQRSTGHQVVVWIGKTLDGAPLDDWAARTFAAWKVGRSGFDDGIVVFVLADDHAIDIEVGYGLEDKVPDAIAARIIRDVMAPRLRKGDRDGSVTAGVDALLAAAGQPSNGVATTAPAPAHSLLTWILGALAVLALLVLLITHPRMALLLLWTFGRGGGGGGGGFSGGGGRSGGGGARGSW
ncbi:MAG: TPM domain-containing protein [Kofleriaceae bacterium]